MGLMVIPDITPLVPGPTVNLPPSKDVVTKSFQINRADTTAVMKMELPADATVIDIQVYGVASDAATTATISVGTSSTATQWINGLDVKTAGGKIPIGTAWQSANLPNFINLPLGTDTQVWAKYAETGTASTVGGPYTIVLFYVR